jgi:hypothetical protein
MKQAGIFFVILWAISVVTTLVDVYNNPYLKIRWGFSFLIIGIILWIWGAKRQKKIEDEIWIAQNFNNNTSEELTMEEKEEVAKLIKNRHKKKLLLTFLFIFLVLVLWEVAFLIFKPKPYVNPNYPHLYENK